MVLYLRCRSSPRLSQIYSATIQCVRTRRIEASFVVFSWRCYASSRGIHFESVYLAQETVDDGVFDVLQHVPKYIFWAQNVAKVTMSSSFAVMSNLLTINFFRVDPGLVDTEGLRVLFWKLDDTLLGFFPHLS